MRIPVGLPVAALVVIMATAGCASTGGDAQRVLTSYLDASFNERDEEAYSYLSDEDRAAISLEDFKTQCADNIVIKGDQFESKTSFKVKKVDVDHDRARAEVEITEPDLRVILADLFEAFVISLLDDEEGRESTKKELEQKYSKGDIPMRTRTEYYNMVKEEGAWKIDL
jgi:hypothetical protein